MITDDGPQYVAAVTLPAATRRITLSIGAIAARVQTASPGFGKPLMAAFARIGALQRDGRLSAWKR